MNIKPLGDRIVVSMLEQEQITKSGIVLPESAEKERKAQGKVVAIGSGEKIQKLNLKIGDTVIFGKYAGDEVEVDKVEHKILKDEEILAVLE